MGNHRDFITLKDAMRKRVDMFESEGAFNMAFELDDWTCQLEELMQTSVQAVSVIWQSGKPLAVGVIWSQFGEVLNVPL